MYSLYCELVTFSIFLHPRSRAIASKCWKYQRFQNSARPEGSGGLSTRRIVSKGSCERVCLRKIKHDATLKTINIVSKLSPGQVFIYTAARKDPSRRAIALLRASGWGKFLLCDKDKKNLDQIFKMHFFTPLSSCSSNHFFRQRPPL
jgi:hypothetical protein